MNKSTKAIEPLVIETWNATLADKPATLVFAPAFCEDWLPALSDLLRQDGRQGLRWLAARQLLGRLGRLLQLLPVRGKEPLIESAVKAFRRDLQLQTLGLFPEAAQRQRVLKLIDDELLAAVRMAKQAPGAAAVSRALLAPISVSAVSLAAPAPERTHPHDREASGAWQAVLADSRARRSDEHAAMTAMERVGGLRAGDRISLLMPGGARQVWRVLRCASNRNNLLMENEETRRQGVLGLQSLAAQLAEGRLDILH